MTKGELIATLAEFPDNYPVLIFDVESGAEAPVTGVLFDNEGLHLCCDEL